LRAFSPLPRDLAVLQVQSKRSQNMSPMRGAHGFRHDFVNNLRALRPACRFRVATGRDLQLQHRACWPLPKRLADVPFSC
jgi:hypothetical protein